MRTVHCKIPYNVYIKIEFKRECFRVNFRIELLELPELGVKTAPRRHHGKQNNEIL